MEITKFGHCCLLIKIDELTILTDPGNYSTDQDSITGIDAILITHEHQDHLHIESLKRVLEKNPEAAVITNQSVGKLLEQQGMPFQVLADGYSLILKSVAIEACGNQHAAIHTELPKVQNTGFIIGQRLYYPGDALHQPDKPIEILALPVAGPWLTIGQAIDYARAVKPEKCFPVHDGNLKQVGTTHRLPEQLLASHGITFVPLISGQTITL